MATLSNRRLRKDLKDALADQKGVITSKLAAAQPLTAAEAKLLRADLADVKGSLTAKLAVGIGNVMVPAISAIAASFTGQTAGMTTPVTISADTAGLAGNVTLVGDGSSDVDTLISDWNIANPSNTLSLDSGIGTQVPDNLEEITLTGGRDAHAEVLAELNEAEQKHLRDALADQPHQLSDKLIAGTDFSS